MMVLSMLLVVLVLLVVVTVLMVMVLRLMVMLRMHMMVMMPRIQPTPQMLRPRHSREWCLCSAGPAAWRAD